MADLSRIPIHYFVQTDEYNFVVDNRPLQDLAARTESINEDIVGLSNILNSAAGSTISLTARLNVSTNPDGTIKVASIPSHSISNHTDGGGYVIMTSQERSKLGGVQESANNFSVSINETDISSGVVHIDDSSTIKIYRNGSTISFYSIVPLSYYHRHYGPAEPLVKCRRETDGSFTPDENANPAYFLLAISTLHINRDEDLFPDFFYTSDGIPSGMSDGTPVPYRSGSLSVFINGVDAVIETSESDANLGRFKLPSDSPYFPKYVSDTDYDSFASTWEKLFEPLTESLGPASFPIWRSDAYASGSGANIQISTTHPTVPTLCFTLAGVPMSKPSDWVHPTGWDTTFDKLSVPNAIVSSSGLVLVWDDRSDPQPTSSTWTILRKNNGTSFDYYLGWLGASISYPVAIFYQNIQ